ncbi:protein of unknown function [Burkholderia multivorans]
MGHGEGHSVGHVRRFAAYRRAGEDDQDERDHRMVRVARNGNVPARQPARQRFFRVHERVVLRGAEARARADGIPAPLQARADADRGRVARSALHVRPGAAARDADAAFLRRDPPEPLVSLRGRLAHRAGHQAHLRYDLARRGASRWRVPALHEEGAQQLRRRRARGIREDRRADGIGAPHREAAAPDQPAREPVAVPARHRAIAPARSGMARALARRADPFRRRVGEEGRRAHSAQPVGPVRARLCIGAGAQPLPQGSDGPPAGREQPVGRAAGLSLTRLAGSGRPRLTPPDGDTKPAAQYRRVFLWRAPRASPSHFTHHARFLRT